MSLRRKVMAHGILAVLGAAIGGLIVWGMQRRRRNPPGWEI